MKNNLILVLTFAIFGYGTSFAQEKFIEVMVKDTVSLKPISYQYQISSGLKFEYDYENPNSKNEFSEKLKQSENKIVSLLKKWNYDYRLNDNPEVNYAKELTDKTSYLVKLKDSVLKEEFKARMIQDGIDFYITEVKYENKENKIREIYTRLLRKAQERASLIAELSGRKLGEIIEVSESKSEFGVITSFIENFAYSRSNGGSTTSFQFNAGVLEKSILVKYTIK
ncbi:MAG: SIMPL domain-containing protein [Maribacter sp.]